MFKTIHYGGASYASKLPESGFASEMEVNSQSSQAQASCVQVLPITSNDYPILSSCLPFRLLPQPHNASNTPSPTFPLLPPLHPSNSGPGLVRLYSHSTSPSTTSRYRNKLLCWPVPARFSRSTTPTLLLPSGMYLMATSCCSSEEGEGEEVWRKVRKGR